MNKINCVVDTNILMGLEDLENLVNEYEVHIYYIVLEELDKLKFEEGDRGFKARRALRNIEKYKNKLHFTLPFEEKNHLPIGWDYAKADHKIINFAFSQGYHLLSNDLNVRLKCEALNIPSNVYYKKVTVKDGWVEVNLDMKYYADFLEGKRNKWDVAVGEYLIIRDEQGHEIRGIYKYLGDKIWEQVLPENLGNKFYGPISPKDAYQQCAIHSLINDDFTVITGQAGTGKTLLSLTYALREIQYKSRREKLVIFTNPVKVRGSEQLGYYPGDRTEKLLQNSIGAMLSSKLGGTYGIEMLLQEENIEILPISDIRGYEVGKNQIMYITEAQNLSVDLIKLAIQRCAEGAKIILEGDPFTQVDHYNFEGANNGLRRVVEIFEGNLGFAHIRLPNIYRSRIAEIAEQL